MKIVRPAWVPVAIAAFVTAVTSGASAATPGGTQISNTVSATYSDGNGTQLGTVSNTIVATVAAVSNVGVTPNENGCNAQTDGYPVGANVARTFVVTNNSNISDAYTISASTTGGTVVGVAETIAGRTTTVPNGSIGPALAPGSFVTIAVTISTTAVPVNTNVEISLAARSTAGSAVNGQASSTAAQCAIALGKAVIAGPTGAQSLVKKLVDGMPFESVSGGQTVSYTISYENYGGLPATNAVLTDTFPAGVTPSLNSLQINGTPVTSGATLVGQTMTVALGSLAPTTLYTLKIAASVAPGTAIGSTMINTAALVAQNAASVTSTPAAILDGVANVVYDGYVGSSLPVGGSVVTLVDQATGAQVALAGSPLAPNTANSDPFTTGATGTYAFGLGPKQIGPVSYDIAISAPGYRSRRIHVTLTPDPTGTFYSVTIAALDGQPLAVPGGFALTPGPVTIAAASGIFGNIPLFRLQTIQITKQVDRTVASSGDRLVYTLNFSNVATPLGAAKVVDTLPVGVAYAPGTGLVDGARVEPVVAGRTLTWPFPTLVAAHKIVYAAAIVPGATAGSTLTNVATVSASPANAPNVSVSATASVDTQVINGVFTDQSIVTGRVFIDRTRDGWFHRGDVGIPAVRIYLENGESVTTDANGRYSFPGVRPGMHVLKLDKMTLPPGTKPYDIRDYDDRKSIRRLVHGVFDGGVIQDVNFAIEATP